MPWQSCHGIDGAKQDRWRTQIVDRVWTPSLMRRHLFDPDLADGRGPSDSRFRLACEIYNAGSSDHPRRSKDSIDPQGDPPQGPRTVLQVVLRDSPWAPGDIDKLTLPTSRSPVCHQPQPVRAGRPLMEFARPIPRRRASAQENSILPDGVPLTAFWPTPGCGRPNRSMRCKCTLEFFDPVPHRGPASGRDRAGDRPDHPPGAYVVTHRPR
jgi:hypothetical protein